MTNPIVLGLAIASTLLTNLFVTRNRQDDA